MPDMLEPTTGQRVIRTGEDMAAALAAHFLGNADAGDNAANDDMVAELAAWRRKQRGQQP